MTVTLDILLSAVYLAVGTALFVAAVILAVLSYHRITPRIPRTRYNNNWFPPAPINYVVPRQPPPAHFYPPVPPRPPTVNEYPGIIRRRDEEDVPGEMEIGVQEGSDGDVAGSKTPLYPAFSRHLTSLVRRRYPPSRHELPYCRRLGQIPRTTRPGNSRPGRLPSNRATCQRSS